MEALGLHTVAPTVYFKDNTSCISFVEAKRVTPRVKHIEINVCFLQETFYDGFFIPKYEKSSIMPEDMCTKPCSSSMISWSTKWMTGFRLYQTIDK